MEYRFYNDADRLHGDAELPADVGMVDFWRWAFSDLLEDTLKGLFAEWLVGHLLSLPLPHGGRPGYGNFDLRSPRGLSIEVKSTAYWQSWKIRTHEGTLQPEVEVEKWRPEEANIRFARLKAGDASGHKGARGAPATYKSDAYIFCFQKERDRRRWDAFDLDQWEFYFLSRAELAATGLSSLTLKRLRTLCAPMSASEFQRTARRRLGELEAQMLGAEGAATAQDPSRDNSLHLPPNYATGE